jgi:hypothetical protein
VYLAAIRDLGPWHGSPRNVKRSRGRLADATPRDSLCPDYPRIGLHLWGIGVLALRRAYVPALLLLGPFVTLGVINTLGHWPLGTFRANLFLLVYSAAIAAFVADVRAEGVLRWFARAPAVLTSAAVVLPLALFGGERSRRPVVPEYSVPMPEVLRRLTELAAERPSDKKETLVLQRLHCDAWVYYTKHHPTVSRAYGRLLEQRFTPVCTDNTKEIKRAIRTVGVRGDRVWVLAITLNVEIITRFLEKAFVIDLTEDIEASRTIIGTHK